MSVSPISWQWRSGCSQDGKICAAIAWNETRTKLVSHLLKKIDYYEAQKLSVISGQNLLVILGEESQLPWIDGICYAIYCANEPRIWLPAHVTPSVPISLLAHALYQRYQIAPLLLWDNPKAIIPVNQPQKLSLALLNSIIHE